MKYFGLVDYEGSGPTRKILVTEDARNYLRAQQDEIKKGLLKIFALKPKEIAKFWTTWGKDRPFEAVCLDELVIKNGYNETYAPRFLKVYDDTIAYAGLSSSDKVEANEEDAEEDVENSNVIKYQQDKVKIPPAPLSQTGKWFALMTGERVLQDGILSQNATYRIIVNGKVGPKEIDRLIKKLEVDKEILAESEEIDPLS